MFLIPGTHFHPTSDVPDAGPSHLYRMPDARFIKLHAHYIRVPSPNIELRVPVFWELLRICIQNDLHLLTHWRSFLPTYFLHKCSVPNDVKDMCSRSFEPKLQLSNSISIMLAAWKCCHFFQSLGARACMQGRRGFRAWRWRLACLRSFTSFLHYDKKPKAWC